MPGNGFPAGASRDTPGWTGAVEGRRCPRAAARNAIWEAAVITRRFAPLVVPALLLALPLAVPATLAVTAVPAPAQPRPGVGGVPHGTQSDASYAPSLAAPKATHVDHSSGRVR